MFLHPAFQQSLTPAAGKRELTLSMCGGQLLPVASTGISSYFSKLIPVLLPEKSSLKTTRTFFFFNRRSWWQTEEARWRPYCSRRSLGAVRLDQSSSRDSSPQRLPPPPPPLKPPRSYLHTPAVMLVYWSATPALPQRADTTSQVSNLASTFRTFLWSRRHGR